MDAKAHLLSLGWAGPGHALDSRPYKQKGHRGLAYDPNQSHNTGNGLVKPLLVSQRRGNMGIGKKAHEPTAGNDWWLKGFESALGNIGKSESERSSGTATPTQVHAGKHGGLYGFFIRGQGMEGTIGMEPKKGKKRKSDALGEDGDIDAGKSTRKDPAAEFEQVGAYMAVRDKDARHRKKKEKLNALEEFAQATEYFEARSAEGKKKKKRKSEMSGVTVDGHDTTLATTNDGRKKKKQKAEINGAVMTTEETTTTEREETKEERRERRRKRKERKAAKEAARLIGKQYEIADSGPADENPAAQEARRAERRRRKAEKAISLS